jgi:hypothetical protein
MAAKAVVEVEQLVSLLVVLVDLIRVNQVAAELQDLRRTHRVVMLELKLDPVVVADLITMQTTRAAQVVQALSS